MANYKIYTLHQARVIAHILEYGLLHSDELHKMNPRAIAQLKRRGLIDDLFSDKTYDFSDNFYRYLRVECRESVKIPGGSLPTKQWNESRDLWTKHMTIGNAI